MKRKEETKKMKEENLLKKVEGSWKERNLKRTTLSDIEKEGEH